MIWICGRTAIALASKLTIPLRVSHGLNTSGLDIISKEEFILFGFSTMAPSSFSPDAQKSVAILDLLWWKMVGAMGEAGESLHREMIGATSPADKNSPPLVIKYFAGSTLIFPGCETMLVPAGNYLRYIHTGPKSALDHSFKVAYLEIFTRSGLLERQAPHLEVYPVANHPTSDVFTFEILIPIMPA